MDVYWSPPGIYFLVKINNFGGMGPSRAGWLPLGIAGRIKWPLLTQDLFLTEIVHKINGLWIPRPILHLPRLMIYQSPYCICLAHHVRILDLSEYTTANAVLKHICLFYSLWTGFINPFSKFIFPNWYQIEKSNPLPYQKFIWTHFITTKSSKIYYFYSNFVSFVNNIW